MANPLVRIFRSSRCRRARSGRWSGRLDVLLGRVDGVDLLAAQLGQQDEPAGHAVRGEGHALAVADAQRLRALDRGDEPRGVAGADDQVRRLARARRTRSATCGRAIVRSREVADSEWAASSSTGPAR